MIEALHDKIVWHKLKRSVYIVCDDHICEKQAVTMPESPFNTVSVFITVKQYSQQSITML